MTLNETLEEFIKMKKDYTGKTFNDVAQEFANILPKIGAVFDESGAGMDELPLVKGLSETALQCAKVCITLHNQLTNYPEA